MSDCKNEHTEVRARHDRIAHVCGLPRGHKAPHTCSECGFIWSNAVEKQPEPTPEPAPEIPEPEPDSPEPTDAENLPEESDSETRSA